MLIETEEQIEPTSGARNSKVRIGVALAVIGVGLCCVAALHFRPPILSKSELRRPEQAWSSGVVVATPTEQQFADLVDGLPGMPLLTPATSAPQSTTAYAVTVAPSAIAEGTGESYYITTTPPPNPTVDSNDCHDGEQYFAGNCYQNCSILTNGAFPIRSSPNTCCKKEPCIYPSDIDFSGPFICQGYAVDKYGNCPRAAGTCDSNEELYEGTCFKQCATLTQDEFPYRTGPSSCCKVEPPCWNMLNIKTLGGQCSGYNVGGGAPGHECGHDPDLGTRRLGYRR